MSVIKQERRPFRLLDDITAGDGRMRTVRITVILGVVLLSVAVGIIAGNQELWLIGALVLGGILGLVAMLFLQSNMRYGVILLVITAIFTPFSLPTGTNSRVPDSMVVSLLFLALWLVYSLVVRKRFELVPSRTNLPLIGFMAVSVISLAWSVLFRDPQVYIWDSFPLVQAASAALMVALPAAYLLTANYANRRWILVTITWMMIGAGYIGLFNAYFGWRLVNSNGLFNMWTVALCLALAFYQKRLPLPMKVLMIGQVGGWVLYNFVQHISWVAGWLPGMLCIAVITFFRSRKLFFALVVLVAVIAAIFSGYYLERIQMERAESGDSRLEAWQLNWKVTGEHVLFGTGPGGYAAYYMTYYPSQGMATHNNYIDVIAQTGILGTIFWLWFFGMAAWQTFRLMLRLRGRGDFYEGLTVAIFAGTLGCIVIMAFGDWLLPFAYTQTIGGFDYAVYSWIFMGAAVAIDRLTLPESESATVWSTSRS